MKTLIIAALMLAASVQDLPQQAQTTIAQHFPAEIIYVEIDRDLGLIIDYYDVHFADGTEVKFNSDGEWKEIEGNVPEKLLPKAMTDYVKSKFPSLRIKSVEKNLRGYDVELTNDIDMKFNKDGSFRRMDD